MLGYPDRHGWQVLYSPKGINYLKDGEKPTNPQIESFLQNYLYFGLLHDTIGDFSDGSEYIKSNGNGELIITTAALYDHMVEWSTRMKVAIEEKGFEDSNWWKHISKICRHTWKVALNTKSRMQEEDVDPRIWFSIAVLEEAIEQVMRDVCRVFDKEIPAEVNSHS